MRESTSLYLHAAYGAETSIRHPLEHSPSQRRHLFAASTLSSSHSIIVVVTQHHCRRHTASLSTSHGVVVLNFREERKEVIKFRYSSVYQSQHRAAIV